MKRSCVSTIASSVIGLGLLCFAIPDRAYADFGFGKLVKVGPVVNSSDWIDCFSSDGLEMYISSGRAGGQGSLDLWVLRRASVDEDWGPAQNLGPAVNGPQEDGWSSISADGLTLYFESNRPGGTGARDIYATTRATKNDPWDQAVNLGPKVNSGSTDCEPWISADGLELYFGSYRGGYGACDIWVTRRATTNDPWGQAVNAGPVVNSAYEEHYPSLSPDGLLLLFSDCIGCDSRPPRPGGYGGDDMWMARRASLSDPWQTPVNLGPMVNNSSNDAYPRISLDGRALYFRGNGNNWQAPILPIVDFNGDGKVDVQDLRRLIESWDKDPASVDIGPMPWGDGNVDEKDLEVFMSYWGQEVNDPTLIAHWRLDETSGMTAADSAGTNDGTLMGNPTWQPNSGKVKGALKFDGGPRFVMTKLRFR
ncbi:MAG: hypothetical protein NTZ17_11340 [Phycisphaerae bacterium]|nr:hypothetical protein [Phycisphaerae bacterium]